MLVDLRKQQVLPILTKSYTILIDRTRRFPHRGTELEYEEICTAELLRSKVEMPGEAEQIIYLVSMQSRGVWERLHANYLSSSQHS